MGGKTQGQGFFSQRAEDIAKNLMKSSGPTRKLVFQQLAEALKTGGIEARTPQIQNAVEQGLSQGSQAQQAAEEAIFKSGASRTPYAKETLAAGRATTERAIAQIPSEVIGATVMGAPNQITAANQAVAQLMGVAQQGEALSQAAKAQNYAYKMAIIGGAVGGLAGIARQAASYGGGGGGMGGG